MGKAGMNQINNEQMNACGLKLPRIISDGMVLQRETAVKIWGWAAANSAIAVEFAGRTYKAAAGADGKWEVILEPMRAGGPYNMKIMAGLPGQGKDRMADACNMETMSCMSCAHAGAGLPADGQRSSGMKTEAEDAESAMPHKGAAGCLRRNDEETTGNGGTGKENTDKGSKDKVNTGKESADKESTDKESTDKESTGKELISSITVKDILIGDVWLCSGQSNMQTPISRTVDLYKDEVTEACNNEIRYFCVPECYDFNKKREDMPDGEWQSVNPESIMNFAAVPYFFAAALYKRYHVPIGLINSSVGGSPIVAWMSEESLEEYPHHLSELARCKDDSYVESVRKRDAEASTAWFEYLDREDPGLGGTGLPWYDERFEAAEWQTVALPASWAERGLKGFCGSIWLRKEIDVPEELAGKPAVLRLGTIVDSDVAYLNGKIVGATTYRYPPRKYNVPENVLKPGKNVITVRTISNAGEGGFIEDKPYRLEVCGQIFDLTGEWKYKIGAVAKKPLPEAAFMQYKPTGLYNAMIAPLFKYRIKGFLWYQGESDTSRAYEYSGLFAGMAADWRRNWDQSNLPFLVVQLANYGKPAGEPGSSEWAELREAQSKALSLPNTAVVATYDVGEWNDLHPLDKKPVGERLALAARALAYGEDTVYCGPVLSKISVREGKIILKFANSRGGLTTKDGGKPKQFAIAGADGKFVRADAEIIDDTVIVQSDRVAEPVAVSYAWADNPDGANLCGREGLLAFPFRVNIRDRDEELSLAKQ